MDFSLQTLSGRDLYMMREAIKSAVRQKVVDPKFRERLIDISEAVLLRAYLAMSDEQKLKLEILDAQEEKV